MFHPIMYDRNAPVGSYWQASAEPTVQGCEALDGDVSCDVAIIGAGYTGLSAAYHLTVNAGRDVRVLEAGVPGWGASGRNGGHCCFGGAGLDPEAIVKKFGIDVAKRNIATQRESIELVDDLARSHDFDIDKHGHGELCIAHKASAYHELQEEQEMWRQLGGFDCRLMSAAEVREEAFDGPDIHGGMLFPFGFGLHPLKYAQALANLALRSGAKIHSHSAVTKWTREAGSHRLHTASGTVTARQVLIATNGFTLDSLHAAVDGCLLPGISQVVATRALSSDELSAHQWRTEHPLYDTRPMFSYFQMTPHNRLVIGSGGGLSGSPRSAAYWHRLLTRRIVELFPQWSDVEITHGWRGFFCVTKDRLTHIGEVENDPGVFYSLAYHGNGVAMATWSGRAVAGMMTGSANTSIPETMRQPLQRYPIPALRKWHLYLRYSRQMLAHWLS